MLHYDRMSHYEVRKSDKNMKNWNETLQDTQ